MQKKYICLLGPDESYKGGMLEVIHQIMNTDFKMNEYSFIHIGTASRTNKILTFIKGIFHYVKLCIKNEVKLVHIHMSEGASIYRTIVLVKISRVFKVKSIVHSHGGMFFEQYTKMSKKSKKCLKKIFNKVDKIVVLTDGWKKIWEDIVIPNKIIVIPNGINIVEDFKKEYKSYGYINLLFLGNISNVKGIYELIDAVSFLAKDAVKVKLKIAGGGEVKKCIEYIETRKLDPYIDVLGWVSGNEKKELLKNSDILMLPSHFESFGIAALEGMIYKMPVICGSTGFTKEIIIDGETGFVVKTGDVNDIANKIRIFLDDKILSKMGEKAYIYVLNNYNIELIMKKYKEMYMELI